MNNNKTVEKTKRVKDPERALNEMKGESKGRSLKGLVVGDKMDKTIVVRVDRYRKHPKYEKRYKISKKYKAHDAKNKYKIGDKVVIRETKPISRHKKWRVL